MAKKRKAKRRFFARSSSFKAKKTKRRSTSKRTDNTMMTILGGMAYGASREYVSDKLSPITSKVPLGEIADEAGMLALSYAVATGKVPIVNKLKFSRNVGKAGMLVESARLGEYFADKFSGTKKMTVSVTNQQTIF